MELSSLKLPNGTNTMEVTHGTYIMEVPYWNLRNGSYFIEHSPWKLPHGTSSKEVTYWNLHHGRYIM